MILIDGFSYASSLGQIGIKVLKLDVWKWLHQDEVGFTFQSMQYKEIWSRLDRMYVMHDESFLPEMVRCQLCKRL